MQESSKGRTIGRTIVDHAAETFLSVTDFARYADITTKTVRKNCRDGRYPGCHKATGNGGEGWKIPLNSLPTPAQIAWHENQHKKTRPEKAKPGRISGRNNGSASETGARQAPSAFNDQAYKDALWDTYLKATKGHKDEAARRAEILHEYNRLAANGARQAAILDALREKFGNDGVTRITVYRYRKTVKGQDASLWAPLLLPEWKGKTHRAEFTDEALEWIKEQYLIQSEPPLTLIYERAQKIAPEKGWILPSIDTVNARLKELDPAYVTWKRKGDKALAQTFLHQERDYSGLALHEIWCSDGHKADVFVKNEAGEVFRPYVAAWMDVRSRRLLGWSVGKSETAHLVRSALHKSIVGCGNAIPRIAQMDNGRAYASKENTGGAPNRYRFKVKENEIPGTMTLLGIESQWVTPGHGAAKPIEPFWRNVTAMVKTNDFEGAYCGNKPDAKPENFSEKNAVPLAVFLRRLEETFADYNARGHRGNSMHGKSPDQVYESLLQTAVIRQATEAQLKFCFLAGESVSLDPNNGSFKILGNRYWSEACSGLSRMKGYSARYDPDNLSLPVSLFLNDSFLFEVPVIEKTGFNNKEAGREYKRRKSSYKKSVKQLDQAREKMWEAENSDFSLADDAPDPATPAMPKPKIAEPVRLPLQMPPAASSVDEEEAPLIGQDKFEELLAKQFSQQGR
jgi:putative transposase